MAFPKGLFCHNFGVNRSGVRSCSGAWCGCCYKYDGNVEFHVAEPMNDEGLVLKRKEDKERFMVGRDGDMLMSPFQCDLCWFVNLKRRLPLRGSVSGPPSGRCLLKNPHWN